MAAQIVALRVVPDGLVSEAQQLALLHFSPRNQGRHADAKRTGKSTQQRRRWTTLAAFYFMDHGPRHARALGKFRE